MLVHEGLHYLCRGLRVTRLGWRLYAAAFGVFALPSLVAWLLTAGGGEGQLWHDAAVLGLPWLTIVLGATVVMVLTSHLGRGQRIGFWPATAEGLRWVPRYVWTNAHTSAVFWIPVGSLIAARRWQEMTWPLDGAAGTALTVVWWLAVGALALYIHTRTLLAPFLAVHGNLPGTLAAVEAWRLSGRHFRSCFAAFVAGSVPVGLPLILVGLGLVFYFDLDSVHAFVAGAPDLVWIGVHALRPVLVPTVYWLYRDLWYDETARREAEGAPPLPDVVRAMLDLTRPLPNLSPRPSTSR